MRPSMISSLSLSSFFLLAALASGCGDKAKKKTVASTPIATEAPGPAVEDEPTPEEATASAANLQDVLYFAFDSSDLDDDARGRLQNNADWMKEDASRVLTVEGHTDEAGTTDYNLALGERRARITKEYLVRLGVDGARVQIITYGEERPAGTEDSKNRRSVFVATRK